MASILSQALSRIADMQVSALAGMTPSVKADAVPYYPYEQEAYPYFTNRLLGYRAVTSDDEEGMVAEDVAYDEYIIAMRLVMGHLKEGYEGDLPENLYEYVPVLIDYFDDHQLLTSTTYLTELNFVEPRGVLITGASPYGAFQNAGTINTQLGIEFSLRLPLLRDVF